MLRYSALALVFLAAGTAQAAEKTFDRTLEVAPGGSLVVDTDGSDVNVIGSDANQVVVHMVYKGSEKEIDAMSADAVLKDNVVTVTLKRPKSSWFSSGWNTDQRIDVTVPHRFTVTAHTAGGGVTLRGTTGNASLNTSGGDVSADSVTGNLQLRTSGGTIHAETIKGDVDANTSGGDAILKKVDGKIKGKTSGGSVTCSLVGANRGIWLGTSGGDIEVTVPKGTTGTVDLATSGGGISTQIPVTATESNESKLKGALNGGGAEIYAHTSGGSVSLRAGD